MLRQKIACSIIATLVFFFSGTAHAAAQTAGEVQKEIETYTKQIETATETPARVNLYIKRGDAYFNLYEFANAVEDYNSALELDKNALQAYFGRGMALARDGFIEDGIKDLTVYLQHKPDSSLAYTKRGVRYLWLGDRRNAEKDLRQAIKLDGKNAEAHDDLGVVLAQKKHYTEAVTHFSTAIAIDPSYQKAHHNLALTWYLGGQDNFALASVDNALRLKPEARDSVLLKAEILKALGRTEEASALREEAVFLDEGNWSERAPLN